MRFMQATSNTNKPTSTAGQQTSQQLAWLLACPSPPMPALQTNDKMAAQFSRWSAFVAELALALCLLLALKKFRTHISTKNQKNIKNMFFFVCLSLHQRHSIDSITRLARSINHHQAVIFKSATYSFATANNIHNVVHNYDIRWHMK